METDALKQKVLGEIDRMQDEIVQTTSDLVKIRSVNPRYPGVDYDSEIGGETKANEYLKQRYKQLELDVDTCVGAAVKMT